MWLAVALARYGLWAPSKKRVEGFLEYLDMLLAALNVIEVIVTKYGNKLSAFSVTRLLNDLLLFQKSDGTAHDFAKKLIFKMIEVSDGHTFFALVRLMVVCDEGLQSEIVRLLLEIVMTTKKLNCVIVAVCCRVALEGLSCSSSETRLAAFQLVYALYHRGTPKDALVKFFAERNAPRELLDFIRAFS